MEKDFVVPAIYVIGIVSILSSIISGLGIYILRQKDKSESDQWDEINSLKSNSVTISWIENIKVGFEKDVQNLRAIQMRDTEMLRKEVDRVTESVKESKDTILSNINSRFELVVELIRSIHDKKEK